MEEERADEIPRRWEIKQIVKRRLYFRGEQYWWYSDSSYMWNPPNQPPINMPDYEQPAFQHVTNIIQPTLGGLQSVLSQNNTQAKFFPKSVKDPISVATAKQATQVVDLIHRNNDWKNKIDEVTYFMGTDGFIGAYVRYVSDAELFGAEEQDVYGAEEVPVSDPMAACSCGYVAPGTTEENPTCPDCGEPMQDIPAQTAQVPKYMGTISIPNGEEVITIVGALNLKRNMWADDQKEFLYLEWIGDVHKARAMGKYPHAAQEIKNSSGVDGGTSGTSDTYERTARRLLYLGTGRQIGTVMQDLGVMRRAWIRPDKFQTIENQETRQALLTLFPKGCHAVFYNEVYCESKNESMDEKWETMHTMPGEGQVRETLISSLMPIQDQVNDGTNLIFEQCMNGVPETFADQNTMDFEARSEQGAMPGNTTPVDLQPGQDIRSKIMVGEAVEPSEMLKAYVEWLVGPISQFLSGYFPALFGGDTGGNDTAAGIAAQRNQALGRLGRAWRRLQIFCANVDGKAVKCFANYRQQDVQIPKSTNSGSFDADFISIKDMQGEIVAYPEVDAQYPTLQSDVRSMLLQWFEGANPLFMAVAQQPENMEYIFDELGATNLQVPGQQQRKKTYGDIEKMLQEQAQEIPPMPQPPPMPGEPPQPPPQPQFIPSVKPDPLVDNLSVAMQTAKDWMISDAGIEASTQNPNGYMNVRAFINACDQLQKQQEFQTATVSQAIQGNGPAADLGGAEHISSPPSNNPSAPEPPSPTGSQP